jgi:hypothetical protein
MEGGVAKLRISGDELLAVEETTSGVLKQIFGFSLLSFMKAG